MNLMNGFYFIVFGVFFLILFCSFFKRNKTNQKVIKPVMHTKNKWLNPEDNFGKMEKGVVID
jgi:hypothetical protein